MGIAQRRIRIFTRRAAARDAISGQPPMHRYVDVWDTGYLNVAPSWRIDALTISRRKTLRGVTRSQAMTLDRDVDLFEVAAIFAVPK